MQQIVQHIILALIFAVSSCVAEQTIDSRLDAIDEMFRAEEIVATLVVRSVDAETIYVHNERRSTERFAPASTFKIPNTLMALDTRVVDSKESAFKWDGKDKGMPRWNMDQTLESAFRVSCVWCYQEIARKVGAEHYEDMLARLSYGNQFIGSHVDLFWLNGDLRISAIEQIEFLHRLVSYELPFQREDVDTLTEIMLTEKNDEYSMYAKTGWATTTPQVAWYVGFVRTDTDTWLFAMNMRVDTKEQASLRKDLTVRSLQALGII